MSFTTKVLLVVLILVFGVAGAFLFDRSPPFVLLEGKTIPAVLTPGKPYQFSWLRQPESPRECTGTVFWRIEDSEGAIRAVAPEPSLFALDNSDKTRRVVGRERILSSSVPPGPIILYPSIEFVCNWMHYLWPIYREFPPVHSTVGGSSG